MKYSARSGAACLCLAFACSSLGATNDQGDSFSSWFTVELVVYANIEPATGSETWALARRAYPANMVAIAPATDEALQPHNLGQLRHLLDFYDTLDFDEPTNAPDATPDSFRFDDHGRTRRPRPISGFDQADLQSGLYAPGLVAATGDDRGLTDDAGSAADATADGETPGDEEWRRLLAEPRPQPFRALQPELRTLNTIERRLRISRNYRVLYHAAWLQPIVAGSRALPILIQNDREHDGTPELDGIISLSLSRYLHVQTDLWFTTYTDIGPLRSSEDADAHDFSALDHETRTRYAKLFQAATRETSHLPEMTYRLRQSRRMRSAELHFLDHPAFGLLIRIDRYTPPTEEEG